jgi:hypothetical protein
MLEYSKEQAMTENPKIDMTIYNLQAEISKTLANPIRLAILHNLRALMSSLKSWVLANLICLNI